MSPRSNTVESTPSTSPSKPVDGRVRVAWKRVLADHALLRSLMDRVAAVVHVAVTDEKRRPEVREALAKLRDELERHLDYEETVLLPLLGDRDGNGRARALHMAGDHAGQRALLVALNEDAGDGVRSITALADEIDWFIQSLLRDMVDEEARLFELADR